MLSEIELLYMTYSYIPVNSAAVDNSFISRRFPSLKIAVMEAAGVMISAGMICSYEYT